MSQLHLKRALKTLKSVDMFSKPVQLLIKQDEGHKTIFGAILTLTLITIFTVLLSKQLVVLYDRENPTFLQTEIFHHKPDYYKLAPNNFTMTFALQNPDFQTYIDESIYVVIPELVTKITKMENGKNVDYWTSVEFPLTTCTSELLKQKELKGYFEHQQLPTNHCIDWDKFDQIPIEGTFDAPAYRYLHLTFQICTEATKRGAECKDRETIKKTLAKNYFSLQLSSYTIDITNPYNPHVPKGEDLFTTISSQIFKEISIYLQPITTITNYGIINDDIVEEKTVRYQRHTEMIDLNESDTILNVAIRLDTIELVNYRTYPKIQSILGELGGLWQVLFTAALIFQSPISNLSYKIQIINSLFNFENKENTDLKQQNVSEDDQIIEQKFSPRNPLPVLVPKKNIRKNVQSSQNLLDQIATHRDAQNRLRSIFVKNQQLEGMNDQDVNKAEISKAITNSIKNYFKTVSKKLQISCMEYMYFLKCFITENVEKKRQIQFSLTKMEKQIDILYIIKKLQEIDKLKMILLSQSQIKVFDYLPKPMIQQDPLGNFIENQSQYFSILKPEKTNYQRAIDAQQAFQEVSQDLENPINRNLIQCMDDRITDLLQLKFQAEQESPNIPSPQHKDYHDISKNVSKYQMIINNAVRQ